MKNKYILYAVFMVIVLPALIASFYFRAGKEQYYLVDPPEQSIEETESVMITVLIDGSPTQMELEVYITGVVLAEMPASFHMEALKAQSVVARTFTLKRTVSAPKHDGADVCTDYTCCQAYCPVENYLAKGGKQADLDKIMSSVSATQGQVLLYQGKLIEATYFSCSGGRTEDAVAVWGEDIPYLSAVDSPGEESAAHYTDTVSFTIREFCEMLDLPKRETPAVSVGEIAYTDGRGVSTITLNGVSYKGTTVRTRLGLRSTAFVITVIGEKVIITTKGFGHRVGMSQYGADAMAEQGSGYQEILAHYYSGTELSDYKP